MRFKSLFFLIIISTINCLPCTEELILGEILMIPIVFQDFEERELSHILVYRIVKDSTAPIDTLQLESLSFAGIRSTEIELTDDGLSKDYYSSYLDNCSLIFDWESGRDTISNMVIKKSQGKGDRCHKNDPNTRLDKVEFTHKGTRYFSDKDTLVIRK